MRACAVTWEAEMSSAEHQLLQNLLTQEGLTGPHLELGTAAGGTLAAMMGCYSPENRPQFVVIDPLTYFPDQQNIVAQNLARHGLDASTVEFRQGTTKTLLPTAVEQQDQFDFQLIDGCHRLNWVMKDLKWTRLLNVGGIVCLHDYTAKHPGVVAAVDRFLAGHRNYRQIALADSLIALRKEAPSPRPEVSWSDECYAQLHSIPLTVQRKWSRWQSKRAA